MKKRLSFIFFCLVTLGISQPLFADDQSGKERFERANALYEKGDSEKALEIYRELVRQGFSGSPLYYNLGNIYYEQGNRGLSILWYERAKKLDPRDADIQFNLSLARSHIKNASEPLIQNLLSFFTTKELAWFLTFFIWGFFIVLGLVTLNWVRGETWPGVTLWSMGILLGLTALWLGFNVAYDTKPFAIVHLPPGEVRRGPGPDYAVGFTIPVGSKVIVLNKRPEWTQVGVPQEGLKGWIPTKEIEEINLKGIL